MKTTKNECTTLTDVEKIIEESLNKTSEEIERMYKVLNESITNYVSRSIMFTSEEHPLKCNITLDYFGIGISSCYLPNVVEIFQDSEGIIRYKLDSADYYYDFCYDLFLDEKMIIARKSG